MRPDLEDELRLKIKCTAVQYAHLFDGTMERRELERVSYRELSRALREEVVYVHCHADVVVTTCTRHLMNGPAYNRPPFNIEERIKQLEEMLNDESDASRS